jgi:hypothetical protein
MLSKSFRIDRPTVGSSPTTAIPRLALLAGSLALAFTACAGSSSTNNGAGGSNNSGGSSNGGSNAGGSGSGGSGSGGKQNGGSSGAGGSQSGGSNAGGSGSGGTSAKGGSAGGSAGSGAGGSAGSSGGSATGGSASGGSGAAGSGGGSSGTNPPGWYTTKDWSVTSADWHGCVWTGVDCKSSCPAGITAVPGSTTSVTPADFTAAATEGGPYQVAGSVFNDYNSVALLGFDLNDTPKGNAQQCSNSKRDPAGDGPPAVAMPSSATGIAVNWTAAKLPLLFRIQIQGVKGATDATNRWCATIKDPSGPSFVPFTDFSTTCWNTTGTKYNNEPISSVAFLVPGDTSGVRPFDITVVGFAPGTSKTDAPGKAAACGSKTGTVGGTSLLSDSTKATDASMQRAAVQGKDCKTYIVNNNNWGSKATTYQQLTYTGNSFKIDAANGTATGQGVPASFPSLYVGGNGAIGGGAFNTWSDTGLPKSIGDMKSAQSTFKWSGKSSGDFNVTYDIWFAKTAPTAGSYNDGISGLLMVWLYKPGSRQPIGSVKRSATIGGTDFDVWIGPRSTQSSGTDDSGRPVISYVAKSTVSSFSGDLKAFFDDAVKNGASDMSAGGTSQAFANSWLLTDVFGGFELWSAGDGVGLSADEFTVKLQ